MTTPFVVRPVPDGDTGRYALQMVWDNVNSQWVPSTTGGAASSQVQGTAADGAAATGNPVQIGGVDGSGNAQAMLTDTSGRPIVVGNSADGAAKSGNSIVIAGVDGSGNVLTPLVAAGITDATSNGVTNFFVRAFKSVFNGSTWDRETKANLVSRLLSAAASTNATLVKNAAGTVHKIRGYNAKASFVYLKLYNKATAPTVGTDTPVASFTLPASAAFEIDLGPYGLYFATGIGFGLTGAIADADTTALVAADITGLNVLYS